MGLWEGRGFIERDREEKAMLFFQLISQTPWLPLAHCKCRVFALQGCFAVCLTLSGFLSLSI